MALSTDENMTKTSFGHVEGLDFVAMFHSDFSHRWDVVKPVVFPVNSKCCRTRKVCRERMEEEGGQAHRDYIRVTPENHFVRGETRGAEMSIANQNVRLSTI